MCFMNWKTVSPGRPWETRSKTKLNVATQSKCFAGDDTDGGSEREGGLLCCLSVTLVADLPRFYLLSIYITRRRISDI